MHGKELHLLVVDDDAVDRQMIARMVSKHRADWRLTMCDSVSAAQHALTNGRYDVMLLDYLLAGGTGMDVLASLRSSAHPMPAVALSGHADQSTAVGLMRAGAADYLIKDGLSAERLLTTIETVVTNDRMAYTARRQAEMLGAVAGATANTVGKPFMYQVAQTLSQTCGAAHVVLAECDEVEANCLALWSIDGFLYPRHFSRQHAIINAVIEHQVVNGGEKRASISFADGQGSIGGLWHAQAVLDQHGHVCGMLLLMDENLALDNVQRDVVALCASRAGAEIARMQADQQLAQHIQIERALSRCACTLLADSEPAQTLDTALQHLLETTQGDFLTLYVSDASRTTLRHVGAVKRSDDNGSNVAEPADVECPDRWWHELSRDRMIAAPVTSLPGNEAMPLAVAGIGSVLAMPVRRGDQTLGYLRVDMRNDHRWTREEVAMLRSGSALVAAYLDRRGLLAFKHAIAS